jgi:hypothetical protein
MYWIVLDNDWIFGVWIRNPFISCVIQFHPLERCWHRVGISFIPCLLLGFIVNRQAMKPEAGSSNFLS